MLLRCPQCLKEYSLDVFNSAQELICACGCRLGIKDEEELENLRKICREYELKLEEVKLEHIRRTADRIVGMILNNRSEKSDIDIEKRKLKELIVAISPQSIHLYELFYAPRFDRLWEKLRQE